MSPVGVRGVMGVMLPGYPLDRERWSLGWNEEEDE